MIKISLTGTYIHGVLGIFSNDPMKGGSEMNQSSAGKEYQVTEQVSGMK